MSNTMYNAKEYVAYTANEFIAIMMTSFFSSFVLTFQDWGDKTFDATAGINAWALMFMAILVILIITVWICKITAIRLGYTIHYRTHYVGLLLGLIITIASNGYLPMFIPGGFELKQPERLRMGKFQGHFRGWHVGIIASTFPLAILAWIMILNPLYLATKAPFYLHLIVAVCLFAIYSCIPIPFIEKTTSGRMFDFFKYFRGCTFGLEVALASGVWYLILVVTVLLFSGLTIILTLSNITVGIAVYILTIPFAGLCVWVYTQFLKQK